MAIHRNCEGMERRDCLKLGLGAVLGGGFASAIGRRAQAATAAAGKTSCILVWLDGGPSHFETFDPKPDAPAEIRGEYHPIETKVPGLFFSENMTKLAAIADKLTIVRSVRHDQNNHGAGNHYMMTGAPTRIPVGCGAFVSFHPSMGSVVSAERGAPPGLPPYFSLPSMTRSGGPNFLGARHAPFVVGGDPSKESFRVRDVTIPNGLMDGRVTGRRELRQNLDSLLRFNDQAAGDPVLGADENYQQAVSLITSPDALKAFDIQQESAQVRDAYGRNSFGHQALLARRLIEAGVPFVTINSGGWDHHSDIFPAFKKKGRELDSVVAALIEDLDQRGLLDTTLVLVMGEFGRTPKISTLADRKTPGRDHWSSALSVLVAGCKTPRGQVVGATDRNGFSAIENVYAPENLVSSVYLKLGINPDKILYTPSGRPAHLVSDSRPIAELMG
ncbi:hypothetical protein Pan44_22410 [Caulifigura coniformis]|uniref:DUF1501 domain-containing protein n=1 Tax=Caulifigura coniformis TaxID=2527983 RepID=A0A517SDK6_9PLAN|nr:DUF1501 domain-containing protein [Caulifigura coniformis]QDT54214.1 hypothetical protein Pan44_22410 [Caulifigura coniformis]